MPCEQKRKEANDLCFACAQDNSTTSLGHIAELNRLAAAYPAHVSVGLWDAHAWYNGGIMHMKLWVADGQHAYVGSANMDWLSLAQVKRWFVANGCTGLGVGFCLCQRGGYGCVARQK